jgi:hypothetical protein
MALVLNGLSLNSFLTLNEKKEIINWYKEYFIQKDEIIKMAFELNSIDTQTQTQTQTQVSK